MRLDILLRLCNLVVNLEKKVDLRILTWPTQRWKARFMYCIEKSVGINMQVSTNLGVSGCVCVCESDQMKGQKQSGYLFSHRICLNKPLYFKIDVKIRNHMNHFLNYVVCDKGFSGKQSTRITWQNGGHKGVYVFFTSQNVPAFPSLGSCHYQDYKDDYLEELQSS